MLEDAGFAFLLGLGVFFSPCSVVLLPAYVGYYAGLDGKMGWRAGLRFGLAAAAGAVGLFAIAGALIQVLRSQADLSGRTLSLTLSYAAVAVGLLFVVLGILVALGRGPKWTPKIRAPQGRSVSTFAAFGALFAVASLGCSLPLAFALLASLGAAGPASAIAQVAAFALGFAGLLVVAAIALAAAQQRAQALLRRLVRPIQIGSGLLLAAAGLYLVYYYLVAAPA